MEHQSIVDRTSPSSAAGAVAPAASRTLPATLSVSAGIAAVTAHPPKSPETPPRFPAEEGGHSVTEMASRDLDAALQLLAERAQYITGASGAAIALRRGEHNDMLCRASAGSNAPELGALLSMEYGLSGESVRKRQAMRCDDAERDPRVNREGCRRLGISSVVVMPIVSDEQALGVFELFSGKPQAFDERDLSALQRLSEMIETAVKHAAAAQVTTFVDPVAHQPQRISPMPNPIAPVSASALTVRDLAVQPLPQPIETTAPQKKESPKKPLFWSAFMQKQGNSDPVRAADESSTVPPMLRKLQMCQACGFPVSPGRTLCVECEEKQWRGQILPRPSVADVRIEVRCSSPRESAGTQPMVRAAAAGVSEGQNSASAPVDPVAKPTLVVSPSAIQTKLPENVTENISGDVLVADSEALFLNSTLESKPWFSKSWFVANKYVLGALLAVAVIVGVVAWLR